MLTNSKQRDIKIISEVHPQHHGSMSELQRMILQSKLGGADIVKVQLYDSQKLWNDDSRKYISITKQELKQINDYCNMIGIELSASIFDLDRVDWCEELNFKTYKIASRSVEDKELCEKIISINKPVYISLGMYDWKKNGLPYESENVKYLYCVAKYPTPHQDINMPDFKDDFFYGYSDHTIGISSCIYAAAKGAKVIEKHFSTNKAMQLNSQMAHVCSMDYEDLKDLRQHVDSITLIKSEK